MDNKPSGTFLDTVYIGNIPGYVNCRPHLGVWGRWFLKYGDLLVENCHFSLPLSLSLNALDRGDPGRVFERTFQLL